MLKVYIRSVRIMTVGDVGSVNIGTTLNIIYRTGKGEEPAEPQVPAPEPGSPAPSPVPSPSPTPSPTPASQ
ncbi:hypothetical protein H2C83_01950 [Thermoactinomyces sp. AMNI-1]|uniref:Uncharacterized protein n=1 Tax=Thermoactinomyces mirandus TaxID=2756294 RepID=A0A7W1XPW2_9BACL|nr:hypothetical protein [Thermoactinomyces mirandus]